VLELEPGEVTDPVAIGDGFYLVYVRHVKAASIPDFEIVRAEVRAEYLRRGRDRALEKVLASLSTRSNISINRRAVALSTIAVHAENVPDELQVTAGLRYSKDKKSADIARKEFRSPSLEVFDKDDSWSKVTWKLASNWWVAEDNMLYGSVSTGFKSGGFLQKSADEPYAEEKILAWEMGSKNRFFDNRLQANVSAFYYSYTDMQLRTIRDLSSTVTNAGEAKIKGVEIELLARPTEALELNAALAYTSAKFTNYLDDDPLDTIPNTLPLDLSGNDLARSPDFTANLSATYTWYLSWGSVASSVNYYWADEVYFSAYNRRDRDYQDSYHKTDIRLAFNSTDKLWYVALAAQNLENTDVASNIATADAQLGGLDRVQWQAPQTYSLTVGYHF
jgi:iron complex outermembrane receptor protein